MKRLARSLHQKLGDFWWYSLMIFCACRAADLLNAFVGLWLVPKYIGPSELGAVAPLANFAAFLAIPAGVFANTFRNEVSRLSVAGEFGKLKTLVRSVFAASAVLLVLALAAAKFILPHFLERIRVAEGSLGFVVIASAFLAAASPVYSNAVQALKKFKLQSAIQVFGAPVRLVAMLAAMPFRALTGYFVGQAAVPAFSIAASVFGLRKEFAVRAEPYWDRPAVRRFASLFAIFAAYALSGGFPGLVEPTVIRQRLPELDSAGYYMATRFSEIAAYLYCAMSFAFFPFAAELAAKGKGAAKLIFKATGVNIAFCSLLALALVLAGGRILALLPHGGEYSAYWWAAPWLVALTAAASFQDMYFTSEFAAGRFGFLKWAIPVNIAYPAILLAVTGHGYFTRFIPASWTEFLNLHNIRSLDTMLWWMTAFAAVKTVCCLVALGTGGKRKTTHGAMIAGR